jgi:acyl-CoA thioester hydrolase
MTETSLDYPEISLFVDHYPVRITDLDTSGHLAHEALVSIIRAARFSFFKSFHMDESDVGGSGAHVTDLAIRFHARARCGDVLIVEVGVGHVGVTSCHLHYRLSIRDSGKTIALAKTGLVFFDPKRRRWVNVPESFKSLIEAGRSDVSESAHA